LTQTTIKPKLRTNKETKTMKFQAIIRSGFGRPSDPIVATYEIEAESVHEARDEAAADMARDVRCLGLSVGQNCRLRYQPQAGEGAHYGGNGDAYPVTVLEVSKSGHRVKVQRARHKIDPSDVGLKEGHRVATFTPNPEGEILTFTRRANGAYRIQGGAWPLGAGYATAYNPHV
jgi:hypothetical protein